MGDLKETKNVPELRFSEFENEWVNNELGDISDVRDGTHASPKYKDSGFPLITSKNLKKNGDIDLENINYISEEDYVEVNRRSGVDKGDILFGMIGTIGNPVIVNYSDFAIKNVALIKERSSMGNTYLCQYLRSPYIDHQFYRKNTGGTQKFIALGVIRKLVIPTPDLKEQQKIASFLSSVDEKISLLEKEKENWEQYKKGVMQQIFSQKIRFKKDDGGDFEDWREKKLGDISAKVNDKNTENQSSIVLTNSAKRGIVRQTDYFDKDIANLGNLLGYYLVSVDDFVYNPRISKSAPVGPFKRNALYDGIMSPLYTVIRFSYGNLEYLENYFNSTHWYRYMCSVANYGARHDRMNISGASFMSLPIPFPSIVEQQKIASFLLGLDKKIEMIDRKVIQSKEWKKGLLQKMFV